MDIGLRSLGYIYNEAGERTFSVDNLGRITASRYDLAGRLATSGRYVSVICLGAVIRGETTHDQYINSGVSGALAEIGVRTSIPTLFGVLTCNTLEQANARSGGQVPTRGKDQPDSRIGNKGVECAEAALEMVNLMNKLPN